jgi:hypothetical protein
MFYFEDKKSPPYENRVGWNPALNNIEELKRSRSLRFRSGQALPFTQDDPEFLSPS